MVTVSKGANSFSDNSSVRRRWSLVVPVGYPAQPDKFLNLNSVLSVFYAFYHSLFVEGLDPATFRMLSFLSSTLSREDKNEVGLFIEKHLKAFLKQIPEKFHAYPVTEIFDFLKGPISFCDNSGHFFLESQVHVFEKHSGIWLYSNPAEFNPDLRQLFLLGTYNNHKIEHLEVILNIESFFSAYGTFCFFCKKTFRGKGSQHSCSKTETCFVCRRPFKTSNTHCTLRNFFCDSNFSALEAKECSSCNLRIITDNCEKHHMSKVCRFGWYCPLCKKYTFRTKHLKTVEAIKVKHICGQTDCSFCGREKSKNTLHLCPIAQPKKEHPKKATNLGFLALELIQKSKKFC